MVGLKEGKKIVLKLVMSALHVFCLKGAIVPIQTNFLKTDCSDSQKLIPKNCSLPRNHIIYHVEPREDAMNYGPNDGFME